MSRSGRRVGRYGTRARAGVAVVGIAGLCLATLPPAGATEGASAPLATRGDAPIDQQVSQADDDLASASKAVNAARDALAKVAAQLPGAQAKLAAANAALAGATGAKQRAQAAAAAAEAAVTAANAQVAAVQVEVGALRVRISAMARQAYISGGGFAELQILLTSTDPAAFGDALEAIRRNARGNNDALTAAAQARVRLAARLAEAQRLQSTAQQERDRALREAAAADAVAVGASSAQQEVASLISARSAAVSTARAHRHAVKKMYDALRAEQRRIAREAAEAARRQREEAAKHNGSAGSGHSGGSAGGSAGGNSGGNDGGSSGGAPGNGSGGLSWPIPGASANGYTGWRIHPVYGYHSCHTGDDISSGSGTPIHAAADGTVVSVESGGPYGNHTLISHANGLATMYAHQSRIIVSRGQHVTVGQVIGYVGSTGWTTGAHLHFEVHVNGVPYEPMGWFGGGSKHRVSCWSG